MPPSISFPAVGSGPAPLDRPSSGAPLALLLARGDTSRAAIGPGGIAALRSVFGSQVDAFDRGLLSYVDGATHPATRQVTTKAGTIFKDERGRWSAAVWPDKAADQLKSLGLDRRRSTDVVGLQEITHAFLQDRLKADGRPISVHESEVVGELASMKAEPIYAVRTMQFTAAMMRGANFPTYAMTFDLSLDAAGAVAERYGIGEGDRSERGRALLGSIMRTMKMSSPLDLTPGLLRRYARDELKLRDPEAFVNALQTSYLQTFEAAGRSILGPPGAFRLQ